jgi:hypothetical protein
MSSRTLTEDYLRWLEPQLRDEHGNQSKTYWDLLNLMFEKEFVWLIPHDDNRMVDGLDLRTEFAHEAHIRPNALKQLGPCSFLEVLIGLSRRLAFAAGGQAPGWAWQLVTNLELHRMSDPLSQPKRNRVEHILNACMYRTYQPDGQGGFFPLAWPDDDMTKVELWYQMHAFIEEIHPGH